MTGRTEPTGGPEDVEAAFAEIVAGLEREGLSTRWPELAELDLDVPVTAHRALDDPLDGTGDGGAGERGNPGTPLDADDDHFIPPEPPPLPPLRAGTVVALVLFVIAALLLVAPQLVGLNEATGTSLALVAFSSAVGWLVLRMRQGPPTDSGPQDGAQL